MGKKPAIVSRGYGGHFSGITEVQSDNDPRQCGDEPLLLKQKTLVPVYVGKNRFATARKILSKHKIDVILLDDGYQHRQFKRDFNIVLFDASAPSHHYSLLPMGRMRESFSSLKRADALIINKCNRTNSGKVEKLLNKCRPYISESRIFFSDYIFEKWSPLFDEPKSSEFIKTPGSGEKIGHSNNFDFTGSLKKQRSSLICALGNSRDFLKTIDDLGINPARKFIFPDHHLWKPNEIKKIIETMKKDKSFNLLSTAKDAVKLVRYRKEFLNQKIQLWICSMKLKSEKKTIEYLFSKILNCIAQHTGKRLQ